MSSAARIVGWTAALMSCTLAVAACVEPAVTVAPVTNVPGPATDPLTCPVYEARAEDLDGTQLDGKKIARICVHGAPPSMEKDVLAYLRSREGGSFSAERAAPDVRALWDSGFFDDVRIVAHLLEDGRVLLDVVVVPRRTLTDVTFTNVTALSRTELLDLVSARKGSFASHSMLRGIRVRLHTEYRRRGYADAAVNVALREAGDSLTLDVDVTEGARTP